MQSRLSVNRVTGPYRGVVTRESGRLYAEESLAGAWGLSPCPGNALDDIVEIQTDQSREQMALCGCWETIPGLKVKSR
jgi:hypothetical protein